MNNLLQARSERGQSLSIFVLLVLAALIATAGLVIDGGQKVTAASTAEAAAAGAARAAGNAAATQALAGRDSAGYAVIAAKNYLAGQDHIKGSVSVSDGIVRVHTATSAPTLFLSAIGIQSVTGNGYAEANIVATGEAR